MQTYRVFETEWGFCGLVATARGLLATFLPQKTRASVKRRVSRQHPDATPDDNLLPELVQAIRDYFRGKPVRFDVALELDHQPEFRRRVLEACRSIPRGQTASYADLARAAGSPQAMRAVGGAMANNPLPLVVPCHRVVRSDGTLGGFSSPDGVRQKRRLLQLEGVPTN